MMLWYTMEKLPGWIGMAGGGSIGGAICMYAAVALGTVGTGVGPYTARHF